MVLNNGDYVLATKWNDGDPQDQFCIGFYDGPLPKCNRHLVVDGEGKQFRAGGFRRVEVITSNEGRYLLGRLQTIEASGVSLWVWLDAVRDGTANNIQDIG